MALHRSRSSGSVYSTSGGQLCTKCGKPVAKCTCKKGAAPAGDGIVRVSRSTKGRKGKGMTVITGLPLAAEELKQLATELKQKCGTGGTAKNGVIEIQGDHRAALIEDLKQRGYTVKQSGG